MKPKLLIIIILFVAVLSVLASQAYYRFMHHVPHAISCDYLKKRIDKAERQLSQENLKQLYTEDEIEQLEMMFDDIKYEQDCHAQYKKFQKHLKLHPMKGETP